MEREFGAELAKYRRSHDLFEAALCNIIVPWNRRAEFQSLLGDRGTTVDLDNYEQAARIAHRDRGWRPQRRLLELLVEIIRSRERVQEWYLRLPAWDARRAHAVSHHSVIELVKRTYAILNHGRPYEGFEGEHRPAVQAPQGQSLLPAVQRLPLLGMDQRMRADAAEQEAQPAGGRAQQRVDGQLPLPLFSMMPKAQPPPEGAAQVADETYAESSSKNGEEVETEDPVANPPTHALNAKPDARTVKRMARYHRYQQVFMKALLMTPVAERDQLEFPSIFATGPHKAGSNGDTPITAEKVGGFARAAEIVGRSPGFHPSRSLLQPLRQTIRYREKAQRWFERLHPRDARRKQTRGHQRFNEQLKGVYQTLSGGRAYSPTRERERSRWQALEVVGSMFGERSG